MSEITNKAKQVVNKLIKPHEILVRGRSDYYRPHKVMTQKNRAGNLVVSKYSSQAFLHEYGHHVDYSSHKLSYKGLTMQRSMEKDFLKAREEDIKHLKEKFVGKSMFQELELRWKGDKDMGGMSDIFDSISLGVFHDKYGMSGHGAKYYNAKSKLKKVSNQTNRQTEVFAQLFEAWSRQSRAWKEALKFYPNQAKVFEGAIKEILQ